jgi:hypothetical protein
MVFSWDCCLLSTAMAIAKDKIEAEDGERKGIVRNVRRVRSASLMEDLKLKHDGSRVQETWGQTITGTQSWWDLRTF